MRVYTCSSKGTLTLLEQLEKHEAWVTMHLPGARFTTLRCDFGSEMARQGHGDDLIVAALATWCAQRPGFRVIPVAPHAQAHNKAENAWGPIHGGTYANALRARVGPPGWSLMMQGAVFQHNHTAPLRAHNAARRLSTRAYALLGTTLDATTVLGDVGQGCWTHDHAGKATPTRSRTS